ncbi:glycosyltransferase, partial [Streptococcus gallolyticus]
MYIIIPAYEPDQRLVQVVQDIKEELQADIIVVNDGSDASYDTFYHQVEQLGATVLIHPNNLGKGAALKTAFTHIQSVSVNSDIMITVDSDGQHLIKDIVKVARATQH